MNALFRRLRQVFFPELPAGHNQNISPHEDLLPHHPKSSFDENPVAISSPIEYHANHDDSAAAETSKWPLYDHSQSFNTLDGRTLHPLREDSTFEWPLYDSPASFNTLDERMLYQMREREEQDVARRSAGLPPLAPAASQAVAYEDVGALITWIAPTPVKVNGGFGDLFAGTHSRAGKEALKRPRIDPTGYNEDLIRRFKREAATWEKLQHPHILEYLGSFQRDGHLYFVSPFIENGTLIEYIIQHPIVNRIKPLCEAADAISYLHAQDVVHGDIKANNLLVGNKGQVLLCDFGLTKTTDLTTTTAMKGVGSLRWQSPELWDGDSKSFKSDVYAFAMTIAEVLTGDIPFPDLQTEGAVIRAVLIQGRRPTKIPAVSSTGLSYKRVWAVAEACWPTNPEERISMNEASRLIHEDL